MSAAISASAVLAQLGMETQGRQSLSYLCGNSHGRINKWARCKPERSASTTPLTEEQRKGNNFALLPTNMYRSADQLVEHTADGDIVNDMTYEAPRADTDRMRLSDFDGYVHGAVSPMGSLPEGMVQTIPENGTLNLRLTLRMPGAAEGSVRLKDMQMPGMAFGKWYPGVIIYDSYITLAATSDKTVEAQEGDRVISFGNVGSPYAGTYTAVPILSSRAISADDTPEGMDIVQMNEGVTLVLHVQQPSYSMGIKATRSTSGTTITIKVTVTCRNTTASSHLFPGVTVRIAKDSSGTGAVTIRSLGDITVEGNGSRTVSATVNLTTIFGTSAGLYSYVKAVSSSSQIRESSWTPSVNDIGGLTPIEPEKPLTPGTTSETELETTSETELETESETGL